MFLVVNTMAAIWWVGHEESKAHKKTEFYSRALGGAAALTPGDATIPRRSNWGRQGVIVFVA